MDKHTHLLWKTNIEVSHETTGREQTHTHSLTVHSGAYEYFTALSAVGQVTDTISRYAGTGYIDKALLIPDSRCLQIKQARRPETGTLKQRIKLVFRMFEFECTKGAT